MRARDYEGTQIAQDGKRYPLGHEALVALGFPLLPDNTPLPGTHISAGGDRIPSSDAEIVPRIPSFPEKGRV